MKRVLAFCAVCSLLSMGAFFLLVLEDRRLGIALPYSVPLAFAGMLLLTPVLHVLAKRVPARVAPVTERTAAPVLFERVPHPRRRPAQGIVLLDLSTAAAPAEGGA
jgi:hypothetical protein